MSRYGSRMPRGFDVAAYDKRLRGLFSVATGMSASKFGNVKTRGYDSKRESKRARDLHLLELAGEITQLREQVPYELIPAQYRDERCVERSCVYIADFVYLNRSGSLVVEDSKGHKTPDYIIKRKLMLREHGIRVSEV